MGEERTQPVGPTRTILVSGFEPFGGEAVNPAADVATALDGRDIAPGFTARSVILPVTWGRSLENLVQSASACPGLAAVVMLGQAGGYAGIGLERVAVNISHGRDSQGQERFDQPIVPEADGGPAAYFSTLPLATISKRIEAAGLPVFISNSAGTYLCNCVFYGFMHRSATAPGGGGGPAARPLAGFIHLPYLPEQAIGKKPLPPSLSRIDVERAILTALKVTAEAAG